jgi:3-hydroxyacyl-CoA dehydrogenase
MTSQQKISIVGSGLVGKSWAMIFASKGHPVIIFIINYKANIPTSVSSFSCGI